ncbi:kinetochore Sim4 complex subunit FTA2-domain-containing protein [Camillea tinctor]|nr:kinetochore Sim4 complex subunit FTA2-domain-containing protein [Camillea tinctor]
MFPDLPESLADLRPLPHCDGPKMEPFDFRGPQKIEFLEYLGEGLHSHVVKVRILGQVYALKLFRFCYDGDWLGPALHYMDDDHDLNLEEMTAFGNYSEPFSAECRAFGRLKEAGHEELAVQCFGYVLLDDEHERALQAQFSDLKLEFTGDMDSSDAELRSRYVGKGGKLPPIRGLVKEFGRGEEDLRARNASRILRNIVQLQQLGIIHIDVGHRQIISGKIADFSTAITSPHYMLNPELNPHLNPKHISAMEYEAFKFSMMDYWDFDLMIHEWNEEPKNRKKQVSVYAYPRGNGCKIKYNLRSTPNRERVYSFADPRQYDWQHCGPAGQKSRIPGRVSKMRQKRLDVKPSRWYYNGSSTKAARLRLAVGGTSLEWYYKDGNIFPRAKSYCGYLDI